MCLSSNGQPVLSQLLITVVQVSLLFAYLSDVGNSWKCYAYWHQGVWPLLLWPLSAIARFAVPGVFAMRAEEGGARRGCTSSGTAAIFESVGFSCRWLLPGFDPRNEFIYNGFETNFLHWDQVTGRFHTYDLNLVQCPQHFLTFKNSHNSRNS